MITKAEAKILKAIAIISIIFSHFCAWICPLPTEINKYISSISQAGVEIFLFLSGYGIMCSYRKNGMYSFWWKRFVKIYIPLLIVTIPQLIMEIWKYRNHFKEMYIRSTLLSAIGLYPNNLLDGTLWFIPFIFMQYIVFYCSFKWLKSIKYNYSILTAGTLVVYFIFKESFTWVSECDLYAFAFMVGVIFADIKCSKGTSGDTIKDIKKEIGLLIVSIVLYIITIPYLHVPVGKYVNEISLVCAEISFVHIIMRRWESKFRILQFLGNISYELYLTEGIFFWNKIIYDLMGYHYVGLLIHMLIILVLAILIRKLSKIIADALTKKYNNWRTYVT